MRWQRDGQPARGRRIDLTAAVPPKALRPHGPDRIIFRDEGGREQEMPPVVFIMDSQPRASATIGRSRRWHANSPLSRTPTHKQQLQKAACLHRMIKALV